LNNYLYSIKADYEIKSNERSHVCRVEVDVEEELGRQLENEE